MTFFYDFNIKPDIDVINTLEKFNFKGACVFYNASECDETTYYDFCELQNLTDLKLYYGVYIDEKNPEILRNQVLKHYGKCDIIMAAGGDSKINRYICNIHQIDIIDHPYNSRGHGINHILARMLIDNNITVNINFMDILRNHGFYRSRILTQIRNILKLQEKFNFRTIFSSGSKSFFDVRSAEGMISLASLLDLDVDFATRCISSNVVDVIGNIDKRENGIVQGVRIIK